MDWSKLPVSRSNWGLRILRNSCAMPSPRKPSYSLNGIKRHASSIIFLITCTALQLNSGNVQAQESFGDRQIAQMFDDRPTMRSVLEDNPQVLQFIKDRFNSGDDGRRVHWLGMTEDEEPVAFHLLSIGDYPAHIYVPRHDFKSPVDQCAALIFEFFNLENRNGFIRLRQKALRTYPKTGSFLKV